LALAVFRTRPGHRREVIHFPAAVPAWSQAEAYRPVAVDDDTLAVARARQARGESITAVGRHLKIGRSTLYRSLTPNTADW